MSAAPNPADAGFRQHLGLFDATMLVAGSMIGSGIFIVSADISRDVGSAGWLLFVWILTGVMTVIGALSFAELAAMMPNAGGQYVFLREAYGPLPAFLFGWTNFLIIQTGFIAAVGVAFAKFLGVLIPELGVTNILYEAPIDKPLNFYESQQFTISAGQLVAVVIAVTLTFVNCLGVREGKTVQNIFTVAKTVGLLLLILAGLTIASNAEALRLNWSDLWSGLCESKTYRETLRIVPLAGLAAVLVLCGAMVGSLFSADAWANVTFAAGEVRDPRRNLPLSLVLGTGLVILLYVLANIAYLSALPLKEDPHLTLKMEVKVRTAEAEAAGLQANLKQLDAEIAKLRVDIFELENARAKAKEFAALTEVQSFDEQIENRKKAIQLFVDKQKRDATDLQSAQTAAKQAEAEAVFARGIQKARDDRVATAVLERVSPNLGVSLMALAIMISTFGCVNGIVLAGSRLYYAMAKDGLFFQSVGHLNARGVPATGLLLQGAWSIVLIFSGSYNELLDYIVFAALLFYVITVGALFVLRRKHPEWPRPYRAFGYPIVPAVYITLCAIIMLGLLVVKPVYCWPSFIIVLAGIPVYWLWRRKTVNTV